MRSYYIVYIMIQLKKQNVLFLSFNAKMSKLELVLIVVVYLIGCVSCKFEGEIIQDDNLPFIVSVKSNGKHVNVGTIITSEYLITEAYHFANCSTPSCNVTIRSNSLNALDGGILHDAVLVIPHEEYIHPKPQYPIALIKVTPPFNITKFAKLPSNNMSFDDGDVLTMAWGGFNDTVLLQLKMDKYEILNNENCTLKEDWNPDEQICTQSITNIKSGLCDGDYGAPLLLNETTIIGINIFNSCGISTPDRFYNIIPVLSWIYDKLNSTGLTSI